MPTREEAILQIQDRFNINCVTIACFLVLGYDYICTLGIEVNYIWGSRWSIALPLFYLNRYLVFINEILFFLFNPVTHESAGACKGLFQTGIWLMMIGGNVASTVIYLQTCAIWRNKPKITRPLLALQILKFILVFIFTFLQWFQVEFGIFPPETGRCAPIPQPPGSFARGPWVRYKYLTTCVTEAITIAFTLLRARHHVRNSNSTWVAQMYRNGIMYSLCILFLSIANMVVPELPLINTRPIYRGILTRPQRILESILCNRVIFVIYRQASHISKGSDSAGEHDGSENLAFTSIWDTIFTLPPASSWTTPEACTSLVEMEDLPPSPAVDNGRNRDV